MRIVNQFNLGHFKCTLFHYQEKYSLKLEDEFGEIHFKLGHIDPPDSDSLPNLLQLPRMRQAIKDAFLATRTGRDQLRSLLTENTSDNEEEII